MEWIMLLGVLLGALLLVVVLLFVYRWIKRLAWWQIEKTEKAEAKEPPYELPASLRKGASNFEECNPTELPEDKTQPDIPVWRDKPTAGRSDNAETDRRTD